MIGRTHLRILIAADDAGACETLADVLASEGFSVTTVEDGPAALEAARSCRFDVAFLDERMPGADGLEVANALRRSHACRRIFLLTAYADPACISSALSCGVDHVFVKPLDIAAALRMLEVPSQPEDRRRISDQGECYSVCRAEGLTRRETQILALVAQGRHNREIAAELTLSPRTVERHVGKILARLGVANRAEAAAVAIRDRLV